MQQTVTKIWGSYTDLYNNTDIQNKATKIKELIILPGKSISMQKHFERAELWFVVCGTATVYSKNNTDKKIHIGDFLTHTTFSFEREQWHQVFNNGDTALKIIEIQWGTQCVEEDILRNN
jgi:mannose-6-phosphate isomerase-like protein (cupin superfamily)